MQKFFKKLMLSVFMILASVNNIFSIDAIEDNMQLVQLSTRLMNYAQQYSNRFEMALQNVVAGEQIVNVGGFLANLRSVLFEVKIFIFDLHEQLYAPFIPAIPGMQVRVPVLVNANLVISVDNTIRDLESHIDAASVAQDTQLLLNYDMSLASFHELCNQIQLQLNAQND